MEKLNQPDLPLEKRASIPRRIARKLLCTALVFGIGYGMGTAGCGSEYISAARNAVYEFHQNTVDRAVERYIKPAEPVSPVQQ